MPRLTNKVLKKVSINRLTIVTKEKRPDLEPVADEN